MALLTFNVRQNEIFSMNRYDKSFNGVDHVTGRPFSMGHPDGVWIIAIIYTLIALTTVLRFIITLMLDHEARLSAELVAPVLLSGAIFIPPIVMLFRMSKSVVVWMTVLALIYLVGGVAAGLKLAQVGQLEVGPFCGIVLVVLGQAYIAYYTYLMKQDSLLT